MIINAAIDAYVDSANPTTNFARETRMLISGSTMYGFLYFGLPFPPGAVITEATLTLYPRGIWTGDNHLHIERVTAAWSESQLTWANQPGVTVTNAATLDVNYGGGDLTPIQIDVKAMIQDVSNGNPWYGFRIRTDDAQRQLFAAGAPVITPTLTPTTLVSTLTVTYVLPPDPPSNLHPADNQAVDGQYLTVGWQTPLGEQVASQVQTDNDSTFASPTFDSGWVSNFMQQYALSSANGFPGVNNGDTVYWRVRVKNAAGVISGWSTVGVFHRDAVGVLTLSSPSGVVNDLTPDIIWSLSGGTDYLDPDVSNLVTNPSFETNLTGWDTTTSYWINAGGTLTRDTTAPAFGVAAAKIVTPGTLVTEGMRYASLPVVAGKSYTLSLSLKRTAGTGTVRIGIGHSSVGQGSITITPTSSYARYSVSFTATATGTAQIGIGPSGTAAMTLFVDGVRVVQNPVQSRWQAEVFQRGERLWEAHGTTETTVEIPAGIMLGATGTAVNNLPPPGTLADYLVRLKVWDSAYRLDDSYLQQESTFHFVNSGGANAINNLAVAAISPGAPGVKVTWTAVASSYDFFALTVDDVQVAPRSRVADCIDTDPTRPAPPSGQTNFRVNYWHSVPRKAHIYEIQGVKGVGSPPVLTHSTGNARVTYTPMPLGIWLVPTDIDTVLGVAFGTDISNAGYNPVMIAGDEAGDISIGESAAVYSPLDSRVSVRVVENVRGYEGSISGILVTQLDRDQFLKLRAREQPLSLLIGDLVIPIQMVNATVTPTPAPGDLQYNVSFSFFQVGPPWPVAWGT